MALSPQAIAEKGEKIYKEKYRDEFERIHQGKFVAVEIETEKAYVGDTPEKAIESAQHECDGGYFHLIKVGSPGVFRVGYYADRAS